MKGFDEYGILWGIPLMANQPKKRVISRLKKHYTPKPYLDTSEPEIVGKTPVSHGRITGIESDSLPQCNLHGD